MRANSQSWWSSWMLWLFIAVMMLLSLLQPMSSKIENGALNLEQAAATTLMSEDQRDLFPWLPRWRWKKFVTSHFIWI